MVSKEELRYGNKVIANGLYEGRIMTFQRLHDLEETIFFTEGHAGEYLKDCDGIPLTPEILERAGFVYIPNWGYFKLDDYKTHYRLYKELNERYVLYECIPHKLNYPIAEVKFMHQLQNLYFALTNEELPITL